MATSVKALKNWDLSHENTWYPLAPHDPERSQVHSYEVPNVMQHTAPSGPLDVPLSVVGLHFAASPVPSLPLVRVQEQDGFDDE